MIKNIYDFTENFGKRLEKARKDKGMTQAQLARVMTTNVNVIGRYEHGEQLPRADKLYELCDILDVSADWLMGRM